MKVGDYVRTIDGKIGQIIKEEFIEPINDKHRWLYLTNADNEMWYDEETIIKSSSNIIIDLIEVGDYVNRKRVTNIDNIKKKIYVEEMYYFNKKDIKSIVTKEQFLQMEYKVGE